VDGGYVWREERTEALLDAQREKTLYVSGTVSNQGRFYARFDAVVLLSAPADVMLERIESRNTNDYGKRAGERADVLRHLTQVEPLLRATCTHEVDATRSVDHVVSELIPHLHSGHDLINEEASRKPECGGMSLERRQRSSTPNTHGLA
jgi:hypothetical protein